MGALPMFGALLLVGSLGCAGGEVTNEGVVRQATTGSGISFNPIARGTLAPYVVHFKSDEFEPDFEVELESAQATDVTTVLVTFQPRGFSGWHSHTGPVFIVVKSGTLTEYDGNDPTCTALTLPTGAGKIEVKNPSHVHMVRNETDSVAELLVTYISPVGWNPLRIDRPKPGNCPF